MWSQPINLMDDRKRRLPDAVDYHQFFTDADDVDNWMLDILELVSSDDIGKDESNVQTLLKEHKEVTDELRNYLATINALRKQAGALGEEDLESASVVKRLALHRQEVQGAVGDGQDQEAEAPGRPVPVQAPH